MIANRNGPKTKDYLEETNPTWSSTQRPILPLLPPKCRYFEAIWGKTHYSAPSHRHCCRQLLQTRKHHHVFATLLECTENGLISLIFSVTLTFFLRFVGFVPAYGYEREAFLPLIHQTRVEDTSVPGSSAPVDTERYDFARRPLICSTRLPLPTTKPDRSHTCVCVVDHGKIGRTYHCGSLGCCQL